MTLTFIETPAFTRDFAAYFADDDMYRRFQNVLLPNPEQGDVIAGTGGIRKIRWRDPRRGKGKRGGLRVLYLHLPEVQSIILLFVYDKDEQDDLTPEQKRRLATAAELLRKEALASQQRRIA